MRRIRINQDRRPELKLAYLRGGMATYLPGETFGPRVMHDYELVWIISGRVTYHLPDRDFAAPPGAILLSRPGFHERYTWDRRDKSRHAFLHFDFQSVPRHWPPSQDWPVCRVMAAGDPLRPLFRHVVESHSLSAARGAHDMAPGITRIVEVLIELFLGGTGEVGESPRRQFSEAVSRCLTWAQEMLFQTPDRHISLDDLSRIAGVSAKHLCRLFAAGPGVSPMEALRLLRLEQAVALLSRSNLSIKQVAARSGFASQFHFSRTFRQAYGATPSAVRAEVRGGAAPPVPRVALDLPHVGRLF